MQNCKHKLPYEKIVGLENFCYLILGDRRLLMETCCPHEQHKHTTNSELQICDGDGEWEDFQHLNKRNNTIISFIARICSSIFFTVSVACTSVEDFSWYGHRPVVADVYLLVVDVEVDVEQVPKSKQGTQSQSLPPFGYTSSSLRSFQSRPFIRCCTSCVRGRSRFHHWLPRSSALQLDDSPDCLQPQPKVGITRQHRRIAVRQHSSIPANIAAGCQRQAFPAAHHHLPRHNPPLLSHDAGAAAGIAQHATWWWGGHDVGRGLHARPALHAALRGLVRLRIAAVLQCSRVWWGLARCLVSQLWLLFFRRRSRCRNSFPSFARAFTENPLLPLLASHWTRVDSWPFDSTSGASYTHIFASPR